MPSLTKNSIPAAKSLSEINPSDHQQALFFTQSGIPCELLEPDEVVVTMMMLLSIRY